MLKDKSWLKRIPNSIIDEPIGMFNGEPVTPRQIVERNIPTEKIDTLDMRIAREYAVRALSAVINNNGIVTGSGLRLTPNNIPNNLVDMLAKTQVERSKKFLQR